MFAIRTELLVVYGIGFAVRTELVGCFFLWHSDFR